MKVKKLFEARGLLTLLLCISTLSLSAQTITVRGTVTDRNNEPLTGATVVVEGTTRSEERRVGKERRSRWSPYH